MNEHDSELLAGLLEEAGYLPAEAPARARRAGGSAQAGARAEDAADVVLFNTCSVRAHAEERAVQRINALRTRKANDSFVLGVVGCMAQREGEKLFELLPHVDLVCGTSDLGRIVELVDEAPRPGAEGCRVAFVHPRSATGVLLELKETAKPPAT